MLKSIISLAFFAFMLVTAEDEGRGPLCRWGIGRGCRKTPSCASPTQDVAGEAASVILSTITSNVQETEVQTAVLPNQTQMLTETQILTQMQTETLQETLMMTETLVESVAVTATEVDLQTITETLQETRVETITTVVQNTITETETQTSTLLNTVVETITQRETVTAKCTKPVVTVTQIVKKTPSSCNRRRPAYGYGNDNNNDNDEGSDDRAYDDSY